MASKTMIRPIIYKSEIKGKILKGDSLVLYCAFLLRTIFVSSACANERARVQNVRDFPQTNLDSEVNARVLLNERGDPTFFTNGMRTISSITEKKIGRNLWLLFWQMK